MSARSILAWASAGALSANIVPHLAHAVSGSPFPTPFADPPGRGDSSPMLNAVWAGVNAAGTAALIYAQRTGARDRRSWLAAGAGATIAGVGVRAYFRSLDR
ncbi:hypothetical protein AAFP35_00125 [Gordonia sp. CPCC 206044]|uniref:hypothetical protein n=1 Tax=Gordonia sp. CPCC 206044 TaxID=3140793 RepID=UPI003AF33B34